MPLFAVSNEGSVYRLLTPHDGLIGTDGSEREDSTRGQEYVTWQELPYLKVEVNQVSAVGTSIWAIGGDRQIYLFVHSIDLPIRIKEEAFENQRWNPLGSFSSKLLPTDRPQFSSEDGLEKRELEEIHLPSSAWAWEESSWKIEASLNGQPLDVEGWTYAVDFPRTYHPQKLWSSCVRRRKWVRHRVYAAVDEWNAIQPINPNNPSEDPFVDICVGGQGIVGAPNGHLSVWAVTTKGRVLYRQGVTAVCPEGVCWEKIAVSDEESHGVKQVGVGPMGDVWCTLWDGSAIVRAGVDRENPSGLLWVKLEAPSSNPLPSAKGTLSSPLSQISVGQLGAWAVSVDGRVWFRRGVRNSGFVFDKDKACTEKLLGVSWVEMVGNMSVVSVGPNDQVWAIGLEDRHLYMRTGISLPSEPTGRTWRRIELPVISSPFVSSHQIGTLDRRKKHKTSPRLCSTSSERSLHSTEESLSSSSSPVKSSRIPDEPMATGNLLHRSAFRNRSAVVASGNMASALALLGNVASTQNSVDENQTQTAFDAKDASESETDSAFGHPLDFEDDNWENEDVEDAATRDGCQIRPEPQWAWVSGGACIFDPLQTLPWFTEDKGIANCEKSGENYQCDRMLGKAIKAKELWRSGILQLLKDRRNKETSPFKYEKAVHVSSWVKSGKAFCNIPCSSLPQEECFIELEWFCGTSEKEEGQQIGSLTILNLDKSRTLLQWNIQDVRCVSSSRGWASGDTDKSTLSPSPQEADSTAPLKSYSHPRLAIHAKRVPTPLRLQFNSEKDLEDWTSTITSVCCQVQGIRGPPSPGSIWATTSHGEVFVFDPTSFREEQWENDGKIVNNYFDDEEKKGHYAVECSVRGKESPYTQILQNGMLPGSTVIVQGTVDAEAKRFSVNLSVGAIKNDGRQRSVALHFNPRFESDGSVLVVRNSMTDGSWDKEERDGDLSASFTRGQEFSLTIISTDDAYQIMIESLLSDNVSISSATTPVRHCIKFKHRMPPGMVSFLEINGKVLVTSISYASPHVIVDMDMVFWRQIGGHLRHVEASSNGVVWGIAYDGTAWVYTGGWGGAFLEGLGEESGSTGEPVGKDGSKLQVMTDTRQVHVYENQRWNPLTGYSSVGLPTDRPSWSDRSGLHRRSKESTKLPSRHWHWLSDWSVDFSVSGGVDSDGWQYAIDFPATYHANKGFTDYVRRRRWVRVAQLSTKGPWRPIPHTPLMNISLFTEESSEDGDGEGVVSAWAIAANTGDVLYRHGVTKSCPAGVQWDCVVGGEQPFIWLSCGGHNQVWAIGRNGAPYWRFGITSTCPTGQAWVHVEPPTGQKLKQISVAEYKEGQLALLALDTQGNIYKRKEVTDVFPEGTHWFIIDNVDLMSGKRQIHFANTSIGPGGELWAASSERGGAVLRRLGSSAVDNLGDFVWFRGVSEICLCYCSFWGLGSISVLMDGDAGNHDE